MSSEETEVRDSESGEGSPVKSNPRLLIESVEVNNFKSYAGRRVIGKFHEDFTAIVGPNGSGKSNALDALLFVFGKRAKQIRLNKVSDLIHHSHKHPNCDKASVKVFFREIKEGSTKNFSIKREAYKNNSSKYFINDKASSYGEVTELLKKKGVDLEHNRFLILQGEVELISQMKPKGTTPGEVGMLEYLEDIIGSNAYIQDIDDQAEKLDELNEKRRLHLNRVRIVEKERDSLESERMEALHSILLQMKLCHYKCMDQELKRRVVESERKEILDEKTKAETIYAQLKEKVTLFASEIAGKEKEYKERRTEYNKIVKALESSKGEFSKYEREEIKLTNELSLANKKGQGINKDIKEKKGGLKLALGEEEERRNELERSMEKIVVAEEEILAEEEKLQRMFDSISEDTEPLRKKVEELNEALLPISSTLAEIQKKYDIRSEELRIAKEKRNEIVESLSKAKNALTRFNEELDLKRAEKTRLQNGDDDLTSITAVLTEKKREKVEINKQFKEVSAKIEEIEVESDSEKQKNSAINAILELGDQGVAGRLGDLFTVNTTYDNAVSACCGNSLDFIVVDTAATADKCVKHLRTHSKGVASFIILEKISKQIPKQTKIPESIPRLIDLVQIEELDGFSSDDTRAALYFTVKDTLVAEDLDQATRIGIGDGKRYHVVTIDGQLVNASGTMTGGGGSVPMKGTRDTKAAKDQLKSLRRKAKDLKKQLETISSEVSEFTLKVSQEKKRTVSEKKNIGKLTIEIDNLEGACKEQEARVVALERKQSQQNSSKKEDARIQEIESDLAVIESEIREKEKEKAPIVVELEKFQKDILEYGGRKLKAQKSRVETSKNKLESLKRQKTKVAFDVGKFNETIEGLRVVIAEAKRKKQEQLDIVSGLKDQLNEVREKATAVGQKYKDAMEVKDREEEELSELQTRIEEKKKAEFETKNEEVDISNQIAKICKALEEALATLNTIDNAIKKFDVEFRSLTSIPKDYEVTEEEYVFKELPSIHAKRFADQTEDMSSMNHTREVNRIASELKELEPNMASIEKYKAKEEQYQETLKEFELISSFRDETMKKYDDLRKKRLDSFMKGFQDITYKLKEMYQVITLGGDAELELVDRTDPFSEGIVFSVRPLKKSWKNISNLSGGEKTLSSLALVFALHHYKPTPIYIMDEIDAALDFRNVSIIANYIKERRTENAQFIVISLRNNMFEIADRLVGIYKVNDCTDSIALDPNSGALLQKLEV